MSDPIHIQLVREMEGNLRHGDNFRGVGWTKSQENTDRRYQVMLELMPPGEACSMLDVGCGLAHFQEYLQRRGVTNVEYSGLELSPASLAICRKKHPDLRFYEADLLDENHGVPMHDYLVLNGLFIYKGEFGFDAMWDYCRKMLLRAARLSRRGFAINVVSKHVDWERDDLFHVPIGMLTDFIAENCSRSFVVRHDYKLFEYTVYVYMPDAPV
jgi:SAM-dependent methyltransferase